MLFKRGNPGIIFTTTVAVCSRNQISDGNGACYYIYTTDLTLPTSTLAAETTEGHNECHKKLFQEN